MRTSRLPLVLFVAIVMTLLGLPARVEAQAPSLSRGGIDSTKRSQLAAILKQVEGAIQGGTAGEPLDWKQHVLKAADTLAYVPFTIAFDAGSIPAGPVVLYVRATTHDLADVERSQLQRWLVGDTPQSASLNVFGEFISLPPGEMPVGGPALSLGRNDAQVRMQESFIALRLSLAEHEANAVKRTDTARKRPGETERRVDDDLIHPFEDFDFIDLKPDAAGGPYRLERALAVPPGNYDLYVAVMEQASGSRAPQAKTIVLKRTLNVPDVRSQGLTTSSVIVAERLEELPRAIAPERQTAYPYVLGATRIVPPVDLVFDDDEQLSVVFQVLNPLPDNAGKPDVTIDYQFFKKDVRGGEEFFNETASDHFNQNTLPTTFNLADGYDLLVTQGVALSQFDGGDYRLEVKVTDNRAATSVTRDVHFTVVGSPEALIRTAPALAAPFRRDDALRSDVVGFFLDRVTAIEGDRLPAAGRTALEGARAGRYPDVLAALGNSSADGPWAPFLRGLALLALNDSVEPAAAQFRAALQMASDFLPAAFYLGACFAIRSRDHEAAGNWQIALVTEGDARFVYTFLADAFLRMNQAGEALRLLQEGSRQWPDEGELKRRVAAAHLLAGSEAEAFGVAAALLQRDPADHEALFLAMRALFSARVGGRSVGIENPDARLKEYAKAYSATPGPHQTLVQQWTKAIDRGR